MATLAHGGRIDEPLVDEEIERLRGAWRHREDGGRDDLLERALAPGVRAGLDRFDRVQLADVLAVCAESRSLSDAGRRLFAVSRARRATTNDADRLRKYLARFGLTWQEVEERLRE
jgi:transcriptional regulatory protein RtcR